MNERDMPPDISTALRRLEKELERFSEQLNTIAISDSDVETHARQAALHVDLAASSLVLATNAHARLRQAMYGGRR